VAALEQMQKELSAEQKVRESIGRAKESLQLQLMQKQVEIDTIKMMHRDEKETLQLQLVQKQAEVNAVMLEYAAATQNFSAESNQMQRLVDSARVRQADVPQTIPLHDSEARFEAHGQDSRLLEMFEPGKNDDALMQSNSAQKRNEQFLWDGEQLQSAALQSVLSPPSDSAQDNHEALCKSPGAGSDCSSSSKCSPIANILRTHSQLRLPRVQSFSEKEKMWDSTQKSQFPSGAVPLVLQTFEVVRSKAAHSRTGLFSVQMSIRK
jgi:hypothetical protein